MQPSVYLIDDDNDLRKAMKQTLELAGLAVTSLASAADALEKLDADFDGIVVSDIRMPGIDGLALHRRIVAFDADLPVILVTGHGDIPMTVQAMKAGAVEFLTKPFRDQDLLDAVHQALARARQAHAQRAELAALRRRFDTLTPRQRDVLARMVAGRLNKQIAGELGTSEATVKTHRKQVMAKMRAESLADLIRMADQLGLLPPKS